MVKRPFRGKLACQNFLSEALNHATQKEPSLSNYPGLTSDDILACPAYASHLAHEYKAYPLPV